MLLESKIDLIVGSLVDPGTLVGPSLVELEWATVGDSIAAAVVTVALGEIVGIALVATVVAAVGGVGSGDVEVVEDEDAGDVVVVGNGDVVAGGVVDAVDVVDAGGAGIVVVMAVEVVAVVALAELLDWVGWAGRVGMDSGVGAVGSHRDLLVESTNSQVSWVLDLCLVNSVF